MKRQQLEKHIFSKKSLLCIGLDTDIEKISKSIIREDLSPTENILEYNKRMIDITHPYTIAYKMNTAFYEIWGGEGWDVMKKTMDYIPDECFVIADAKRGDIGNTSAMYAKAFFENLPCDGITINPYMGNDSIKPYLEYKNKWAIVLGLTSNKGAEDIQLLQTQDSQKVFEHTMLNTLNIGTSENTMFVVGATQSHYFQSIRKIVPNHFLLIPGVGTQGGKIQDLAPLFNPSKPNLFINVSRAILFSKDFKSIEAESKKYQQETSKLFS